MRAAIRGRGVKHAEAEEEATDRRTTRSKRKSVSQSQFRMSQKHMDEKQTCLSLSLSLSLFLSCKAGVALYIPQTCLGSARTVPESAPARQGGTPVTRSLPSKAYCPSSSLRERWLLSISATLKFSNLPAGFPANQGPSVPFEDKREELRRTKRQIAAADVLSRSCTSELALP